MLRFLLPSLLLLSTAPSFADEQKAPEMWDIAGVPFIFSTDNMSTTFGGGLVVKGAGQPQASLFASAMYSSNDSSIVYAGAYNYQLLEGVGLFANSQLYWSDMPEKYYYPGGPLRLPRPNDTRAYSGLVEDNQRFVEAKVRYFLPIGDAKDSPLAWFQRPNTPSEIPALRSGLNPMESGYTSLYLTGRATNRNLSGRFSIDDGINSDDRYLALTLEYDNTASKHAPPEGSRLLATYTWGHGADRAGAWQTWELDLSHFFHLPSPSWSKQDVIGVNLWTADTPSWKSQPLAIGADRPEDYIGITLGGYDRLRGYDIDRFYHRSALYAAAEYRLIPQWQPLKKIGKWLHLDVQWWQFAAFAELGRVAPEYQLDELIDDMKGSGGVGMRILVENVLVRADWGFSSDENHVWVFLEQSF